MQILMLGVCPSKMVSRPIGRRLPTWGLSSRPTIVGIPVLTTGYLSLISTGICSKSLHNIIKIL